MKRLALCKHQAGLSLIELMVAVTLSMILMLGAVQIFLSSKSSYISNQELSEIQENGRFALHILTRDIRNAGYKGQCVILPRNHITTDENQLWSHNEGPLLGWISSAKPAFLPSSVSSDGIFVEFAAGEQADFEGISTNTITSDVSWSGTATSQLKEGDTAIISDGLGCDIFTSATSSTNIIKKDDTNSRSWSHEYTDGFEALRINSIAYYIAEDQGVPSLFRSSLKYADLSSQITNETYAVVPGVANIELEYGIGRGLDITRGVVTEYVSADNVPNWTNVFAIKLTLTLEARSGLQKEFSTLIGLRNKLP